MTIDMHRLQELVRLHRMGNCSREVARLLRMSPNTARRYRKALQAASLLAGSPEELPSMADLRKAVETHAPPQTKPQQVSSVAKWTDKVSAMLDDGAAPTAIYDYLRLQHEDFCGSVSAIKRLCARLRAAKGIDPNDMAIPVDTEPGEVAQVDFGSISKLWDPETGRIRQAYVFVMVLGYSRHMVTRIVFDQKVETWLRLHAPRRRARSSRGSSTPSGTSSSRAPSSATSPCLGSSWLGLQLTALSSAVSSAISSESSGRTP